MQPRARERGFTLIEMIVVLAVLALAGLLVLTRGPPRSPTLELRQAVAALTGAIRLARTRAIAANAPVTLRLAPPPGTTLAAASPTITFQPDGSTSGNRITLTRQDRKAEITLDWLTGQLTITP